MADSKLRLQIVTALDNAGIKATSDQISGIEQQLSRLDKNGGGSLNNVEKKIGKIQGPIGKLQDMFEGLGGSLQKFGMKALAVAGAFKAGWDIGNWLQQNVIDKLFGLSDPLDELKKKNIELKKEHEKTMAAFDRQSNAAANASASSIRGIEDEISQIDKMRQAWTRAQQARSAYENMGADLEIQKLERERFEDMISLQNSGDYEGAEQVNRLYDFYRKQLESQKEMARYDAGSVALQEKLNDAEEKGLRLSDKAFEAHKRVSQLMKEMDKIENSSTSWEEYEKLSSRNAKQLEEARRLERLAENEITQNEQEVAALQMEIATNKKGRVLLADRLQLGIDQSAWAYDQHINQYGNSLNLQFEQEFLNALHEESKQSYADLERAIVEGIAQGVGRLMEVK